MTTSHSRTDHVLHISTGQFEGNGQLELYHTNGELIIHCQIASNENKQIDLSALPEGIYILRLTTQTGQKACAKIKVL
jgi:hypothetical protein